MIKIVISGYGKMGKMVEATLAQQGISCLGHTNEVAHYEHPEAKQAVCIDFSTPAAFRANYQAIAGKFKAAVVGTTGWQDIADEVLDAFKQAGTTLIWASNFSVGVNVTTAAVELISSLLGKAGGYAPWIVEKHHTHKLDAPSGTAKTLGAAVERGMHVPCPISAVRVGELAGTHTIGFEGTADRITVEHEAFSRQGFASGAVLAAQMTQQVPQGSVHEFKELFLRGLNNQ